VPLIAGGLNHDATRAVGLAAGEARLLNNVLDYYSDTTRAVGLAAGEARPLNNVHDYYSAMTRAVGNAAGYAGQKLNDLESNRRDAVSC
jgi:hypothetical protein